MDKRLSHKGDPCVYCRTTHDEVAVGNCPAFTGEVRYPTCGETFLCDDGKIETARFDFEATKFPIFRFDPRCNELPVLARGE